MREACLLTDACRPYRGCTNPASWLPLATGASFRQPLSLNMHFGVHVYDLSPPPLLSPRSNELQGRRQRSAASFLPWPLLGWRRQQKSSALDLCFGCLHHQHRSEEEEKKCEMARGQITRLENLGAKVGDFLCLLFAYNHRRWEKGVQSRHK